MNTTSSSAAFNISSFQAKAALLSSLRANRVPICTPSAPCFNISATPWPSTTPPAPMTGILTAAMTSGRISWMERSVPRCPPASTPSTITAAAPSFSDSLASLADDTIGTTGMPFSLPQANISLENPAPETKRSIFSSKAA